jgi:hypothetical protein
VDDAKAGGRPAVLCSAEGVYFVEATANCTLADVNFLERPLLLGKEQLVPYATPELWAVEPHNSLAMIQVLFLTAFRYFFSRSRSETLNEGSRLTPHNNHHNSVVQGERHDWHVRKPNVNDAAGIHFGQ